jgi:hypothetical protein
MLSRSCLLVVVPALFALGCGGKPKVEPAATPEEALQQLQAAENAGDIEAFTAILPQSQRDGTRRFFDAVLALEKGAKAYEQAVKARFGDEAITLPAPLDVRALLTDPASSYEILDKKITADGRVELKVKKTFTSDRKRHATKTEVNTLTAVEEEDGWKIEMGHPQGRATEDFERQAKAYEDVAARVKAGEFQNGHEALSALVKAWHP